MATLIPGYRHVPGYHCGSTALRNLLAFHGTHVSEEMAFGLGAGACFYYVPLGEQSPSRFTNGRVSRLEEQFLELTESDLRLDTFEDAEASWTAARAAVDASSPPILLTDLFYLDHYGDSAHFPGHAVVLAGHDAQDALLSDTAFEDLQRTTIEHLGQARHSQHPVYPLSGQMIWLDEGGSIGNLVAAIPGAIERNARQMLEPALGDYEGLPALRRFAVEVGDWPELDDWQWCARFNYQVIERRGTGGGNFRLMYSRFLEEAGSPQAPLAAEAAARWTSLAAGLLAASEADEPEPDLWATVSARAAAVLVAEERLWPALAV